MQKTWARAPDIVSIPSCACLVETWIWRNLGGLSHRRCRSYTVLSCLESVNIVNQFDKEIFRELKHQKDEGKQLDGYQVGHSRASKIGLSHPANRVIPIGILMNFGHQANPLAMVFHLRVILHDFTARIWSERFDWNG